jgi:hypothetical protein
MSINAEISKKLIISSPDEFYNYISKKENLLQKYIEFRIFRDHMFLSKNGCPCNFEENEKDSINIYSKFNEMNSEAFTEVKEDIGCTNIIFKLNDEILFEL